MCLAERWARIAVPLAGAYRIFIAAFPSERFEKQGGNAFRDHQLPTAVISLKQGVGRLIRDAQDRGVMMLCDPRLISRSYGKVFLDSLPPMRRTRRLDRVQQFFARMEQSLNIAAS